MKNKKIICAIIAVCLAAAILGGCAASSTMSAGESSAASSSSTASITDGSSSTPVSQVSVNTDDYFKEKDVTEQYDEATAVKIDLNDTTASCSDSGVSIDGGKITISKEGVYVLSGTLKDGQVIVNCADEKADVRIILNNADITSSNSAPIYVMACDKTIITLKDGTENKLTDGKSYEQNTDSEPNACIFSKSDLSFNGTGTLNVTSNCGNGINCKDDLVIAGGTINVTAANDGIIGKDMVAIRSASITVNAQDNGIKASNTTDANSGIMYIESGSFNITAQSDALKAVSSLTVLDGEYTIKTGGGSGNSSSKQGQQDNNWGDWQNDGSTTDTDEESAKGIKCTNALNIQGGTFSIDSSDDALHSNGDVTVSGGNLTISSGDDGMHADGSLTIDNATVNITQSYEGIEASNITVNSGDVKVVSSDDGFNICGGGDSSGTNGRAGGGSFDTTDGVLAFNGGTVYVNADGDGLDSNGSITISDGTITVDGPTNDGNGALDYNGTCTMTGGTLIAAGSSGMAQAPTDDSTIKTIEMTFSSYQTAGSTVTVKDSSGNTIAEYSPSKQYNNIVVSTKDISANGSYTISVNGTQVVEFTCGSDSITYVNESGVTTGNNGGMGGGMGGGQPGGGMGGM